MYPVTTAYRAKIASNDRDLIAKISYTVGGVAGQITGDDVLMSLEYHAVAEPTSVLSVGSLATKYITYSYYDDGTLTNMPTVGTAVSLYIGVMLTSAYYIPMGVYYITDIESNGKRVSVTAYDATTNMNKQATMLGATTTYAQFAASLALQAGISVDSSVVFPSATIGFATSGTVAQNVAYLAGLMGKSAYITRDNKLSFRWYSGSDTYSLGINAYLDGSSVSDTTIPVGYLKVNAASSYYTYGSGNGFYHTNPYFTQAITNTVGSAVSMLINKRSGTIVFKGDPAIDIFDQIVLDANTTVLCSEISLVLECGMQQTIYSYSTIDNAKTTQNTARFQEGLNGDTVTLQGTTSALSGTNKSTIDGNEIKFTDGTRYGTLSKSMAHFYEIGQTESIYASNGEQIKNLSNGDQLITRPSSVGLSSGGSHTNSSVYSSLDYGVEVQSGQNRSQLNAGDLTFKTTQGVTKRVYPGSGWVSIPQTGNTWTNPGLTHDHTYEVFGGVNSNNAVFFFHVGTNDWHNGGGKAYGENGTLHTIYYEDHNGSNYLSASFIFGADSKIRDWG